MSSFILFSICENYYTLSEAADNSERAETATAEKAQVQGLGEIKSAGVQFITNCTPAQTKAILYYSLVRFKIYSLKDDAIFLGAEVGVV